MLTPAEPLFSKQQETLRNTYSSHLESQKYLDYPMVVSIETFAKCNASCTFCPYVELDRINAKLDEDRVLALIDQVAAFKTPPLRVNFSRVNEPFLDPRLFNFLEYASRKLPDSNLVLFSNGQTLTDAVIDQLNALPTFKQLTVSFNEHDPAKYKQVMGLNQPLTLKRLKNLHERYVNGELKFNVSLSRVGDSTPEDADYLDWTKHVFPSFPASSHARFDWVGSGEGEQTVAPDSGCLQWFTLHVLADGRAAFCCIDGVGSADDGHIDKVSLYEIYNHPAKKKLRLTQTSRRDVSICRRCIHGMPSDAYRR